MKQSTLLFLLKDDSILLAMKKRGFGAGRWNGVGGKIDAKETVEQAAIRECQEEVSVTPKNLQKVAYHTFYQADGQELIVHTFLCHQWVGKPHETEEMAPQWFHLNNIPYQEMWEDDLHWLPHVLTGKSLVCQFRFDVDDRLLDETISFVTPQHRLLQNE